jgi:hypothetical protein
MGDAVDIPQPAMTKISVMAQAVGRGRGAADGNAAEKYP